MEESSNDHHKSSWSIDRSITQTSNSRSKVIQGPPPKEAILQQNRQVIEDDIPDFQENDDQDILDFEVKRRDWLFRFIGFVWLVAATFYFLLVIWVFFCSNTPYAWHTTLVLAITPTTLALVTLKLLAKPENSNDNEESHSHTDTLDLVNKLMSIIDKRSSQ